MSDDPICSRCGAPTTFRDTGETRGTWCGACTRWNAVAQRELDPLDGMAHEVFVTTNRTGVDPVRTIAAVSGRSWREVRAALAVRDAVHRGDRFQAEALADDLRSVDPDASVEVRPVDRKLSAVRLPSRPGERSRRGRLR